MRNLTALVTVWLFFFGVFSLLLVRSEQAPCANSLSCIHNLTATAENGSEATFLGNTIPVPDVDFSADNKNSLVLGAQSDSSNKHIYVDLATQKLYAFDGDQLFMETLVSTGKWGKTPAGEYQIWVKIRSTRMAGGSGSDAYNLPNVPFVMFFYNKDVPKTRGFSLHGAYWHNNFGHPMSHGCVNMRTIDAETLYNWATPITQSATTYESADDPGTKVSICNSIQLQDGGHPQCLE